MEIKDMDKKLKIKHYVLFGIVLLLFVMSGFGIYFMIEYFNNQKCNYDGSPYSVEDVNKVALTYYNDLIYIEKDSSQLLNEYYDNYNINCEIEYCKTDILYTDLENKLLNNYSSNYLTNHIIDHFKNVNGYVYFLNNKSNFNKITDITSYYVGSKISGNDYYYKICNGDTECKIISITKNNDHLIINGSL